MTSPRSASGRWSLGVALASGFLAILLGALVLAGWYLDAPLLTHVRPIYAPMQFNAALGLILGGAALILLASGWRTTARLVASAVAVLGGLTLLEVLLDVDLGLDQAFFQHPQTVRTSHPGRMAPQTALGLAMTGLGVLVMSRARLLAWGFGCAVLGAGLVALLGYASGVRPAFSWGELTDVAVHSAFGMVLLGSGLVAASSVAGRGASRLPPSAPYVTGMVCLIATAIFWQALVTHQQTQVRRTSRMLAFNTEASTRAYLSSFVNALEHVAERWKDLGRPTGTDWRFETRLILDRPGGPVAIEWVTDELEVRKRATLRAWRQDVPPTPMTFAPGDPTAAALERARATRRPAFTPPFAPERAQPAFRVVVPMVSAGSVPGFIAAYFHLEDLLMVITTDETAEYSVALLDRSVPLAATSDWSVMHLRGLSVERAIELGDGTTWTLSVAPSKKLMIALDTALPGLALLTGLILTIMLAVLVRQAQAATLAARELRRANRLLSLEVAERRRAEGEVRGLAQDLERRVAERTVDLARANSALRTENRLRERAQVTLARANEDLRRFASFVSHELRQPLASGQIWGELLESTSAGTLDERGRKYLTQLRSSITRMGVFLEGQLRLARAAYEERETSMEEVALGDLIEQVATGFKGELEEAGAQLAIGRLPVVRADAAQMRQVFRNLIENALKYRRPDAPLRIAIEGRVHDADGDATCEIEVCDNARGFGEAEADEIFKIFRRVGDGTVSGSGLGLALCRRILEHHGGTIYAVGRPGEGATFVIRLPVGLDEHPSAATALDRRSPPG